MTMKFVFALLAVASVTAFAAPAGTVPSAASKKSSLPAVKQEPETTVSYDDLAKYKNQRVIIHTTINTMRTGILTKYSGTQIEVNVEPSGAQFTFLRNGIKSIGIPVAPEPKPEDPSAKKN
jgi:hypothetical protein